MYPRSWSVTEIIAKPKNVYAIMSNLSVCVQTFNFTDVVKSFTKCHSIIYLNASIMLYLQS